MVCLAVQILIQPASAGQKCDQSPYNCPSLNPSEIVFDVVAILCFWLEVIIMVLMPSAGMR